MSHLVLTIILKITPGVDIYYFCAGIYSAKHNTEVKGILFAVSSGWYSRSSKNNVSSRPLFISIFILTIRPSAI